MQPYVILPATGSEPADEWLRLGIEAQVANKLPDAERHYRHALRLSPGHAGARQNLGVLHAQQNALADGLMAMECATLLDPALEIVWANWALMLIEAERYDEAVTIAQRGVEQKATAETRLALAMALTATGKAKDAAPIYSHVLAETDGVDSQAYTLAGFNSCFVSTLASPSPEEAQAIRSRWYDRFRYTGAQSGHANERTIHRPLRVGYVSGDFKQHSAAFIFVAVVLTHDRSRILPYLYSTLPVNPAADGMTAKFHGAGTWRDISAMTDEDTDGLVRQDAIDILVDLSGHTGGNRLVLFTRRPAPIQITGWGFAHGTGVKEMDYFFADPVALPENERACYIEQVWDLPCIVAYSPPGDYHLKGVSPLPANRSEGGVITFGAFSRFEKLSDECLDTWAEILRRYPDSRLLFKDRASRRPFTIKRFREHMGEVDPHRLLFSLDTNHPDHLMAYQQADLILDSFPHTGGVASIEQLYMGVPIVTLYGRNPGERTTSAVLTAMGRHGWIAQSPDEYIDLAVGMAKDHHMLSVVRKTLREELLASPLCNGTYVRAVEEAYRAMWQRWIAAAA